MLSERAEQSQAEPSRAPVTSSHPVPAPWPDGKNRQSKVLPGFLPLVQNDPSQAVEMAPLPPYLQLGEAVFLDVIAESK